MELPDMLHGPTLNNTHGHESQGRTGSDTLALGGSEPVWAPRLQAESLSPPVKPLLSPPQAQDP